MRCAYCTLRKPSQNLHPIKQPHNRGNRERDAEGVDAGDFFAECVCTDQSAECNHADVHACKHQSRVGAVDLMRADVEPNITEVERAQNHACE